MAPRPNPESFRTIAQKLQEKIDFKIDFWEIAYKVPSVYNFEIWKCDHFG